MKIFCWSIIYLLNLTLSISLNHLWTLWFPNIKDSSRIPSNKFLCIFWNFKSSYWYHWHFDLPKTSSFLKLKIPYFNFTILISKYNFNFIRMKNCTYYHDTSIFILSLITLSFKIINFDCTVFTGCKKPFILFLEFHCYCIPIYSVKNSLLI